MSEKYPREDSIIRHYPKKRRATFSGTDRKNLVIRAGAYVRSPQDVQQGSSQKAAVGSFSIIVRSTLYAAAASAKME
jgi:hypothetical protein